MENSIFDLVSLGTLPPPEIIAEPEFEEIFRELVTQFQALLPAYELLLESDPIVKVLQAMAYREMIYRGLLNRAARNNLLAFAEGANLDHLGAFYNVARLTYPYTESDNAFRFRIQQRIIAFANAGGAAHYRFWALSADARVKDVAVYSPDHPNGYNMGGQVVVSVLSREGNLVPTDALMGIVRAIVTRDDVKVLSDIVSVEPAIPVPINVRAQIVLSPRTPYAVFEGLEARLRSEFARGQGLGWDVSQSWLYDVLHEPGVARVKLLDPVADIVVPPNEFPTLGTVEISFNGFSDTETFRVAEQERRRMFRQVYEYYIDYAKSAFRTAAQIKADLAEKDVTGIVQPTVRGLADYLAIDNRLDDKGEYLPEDELCFLIHRKLERDFYLPEDA